MQGKLEGRAWVILVSRDGLVVFGFNGGGGPIYLTGDVTVVSSS